MALDPTRAITQYSVQVWNMESGLSGNSVFAIQQTQDGFLWIGTQDGLVRFDGLNFELYTRGKIPQLKGNVIRALYEDQQGTLWIGTTSGGLTRYREGEFFTYPITRSAALHNISAINEDRWGNLWIGSFTGGLTCLSNGQFNTYTTKQALPHNEVRFIYKDGNGDLWIATIAGIVKLLEPGNFFIYAPQEALPYLKTVCLYEEETRDLWIGTGESGLFQLKNGIFTAYGAEVGVPHPTITYLYEDRMKNIWIGTDGGGLTRMRNRIFSTLSGGDGLACGFVYSIYEDREGILWVGTLDGGLHQLRDSKFTNYTTREGLSHDYINSLYEDRGGNLWIGTKGGLNVLRLKTGKLNPVLTTREGLLNNFVLSIFEDRSGYLWIGTWGGLHRFKNGNLTTLTKKHGLSDNRISCIIGDRHGNTWVGTENGLNQYNDNTGQFTTFSTKQGLLSNIIEFIFEESRGNLWIGTDAGINCLKDGVITTYNLGSGVEKNFFRCVYEDHEGVLWFGSDNGLFRLKEKETTLYSYNVQCGLIENYVYSILEDEKGYLWLAGRNGISRVRKQELEDVSKGLINHVQPDSYNEKDGMKSRWCTGTGCETRDGRFWFPTSVGVTMIDPNNIKKNNLPPPLIIKRLIVDGESVKIKSFLGGPGGDLAAFYKKTPLAAGGTLELAPGKKRLEFYYTTLSFINHQKIKFRSRLEGYDSDWINMGNARSTIYTGLSPGHYTFKVTACNPDGVWNEKGASFSFYLKPYFYQTYWFYILVVFFVLLAVFFIYRFRVKQLRAREKELGALVELRTRDLKERTLELEKTQKKLRQSKEIIEEKNRNITDSIRYARKIQQAMLPIKEKMEKELKDYFVIYEPKAIVSGDFYWFDVIEGQYFLAVADCTGHGVPGALLSMIGYMMLNEVIKEKHIFDPAMILSHLHQGFRSVLKQEIEETDTYDGMEVGLYRIDLKTGKITFAGAGRPLFYIKDAKLVEIKGDRKSIGGRQKEEKRFFTNHEIDILDKKQDKIMLYLTTDGFADQHNPQNQKYGSRRFKKFLRDNAHLSTAQQKAALLKELKVHRANEEQRDDITVIGIRISMRL